MSLKNGILLNIWIETFTKYKIKRKIPDNYIIDKDLARLQNSNKELLHVHLGVREILYNIVN